MFPSARSSNLRHVRNLGGRGGGGNSISAGAAHGHMFTSGPVPAMPATQWDRSSGRLAGKILISSAAPPPPIRIIRTKITPKWIPIPDPFSGLQTQGQQRVTALFRGACLCLVVMVAAFVMDGNLVGFGLVLGAAWPTWVRGQWGRCGNRAGLGRSFVGKLNTRRTILGACGSKIRSRFRDQIPGSL